MKQTRRVIGVVGLAGVLAASWMALGAGKRQAVPAASIEAVVAAARAEAALEPVTEKTIPVFTLNPASAPGTYWMVQTEGPPLPFCPFPELEVVPLGGDVFLVDDRNVSYPDLTAWLAAGADSSAAILQSQLPGTGAGGGLALMSWDEGAPSPPGGGGGGGTNEPPAYNPPPAYNFGSNDLWLEILAHEHDRLLPHPHAGAERCV